MGLCVWRGREEEGGARRGGGKGGVGYVWVWRREGREGREGRGEGRRGEEGRRRGGGGEGERRKGVVVVVLTVCSTRVPLHPSRQVHLIMGGHVPVDMTSLAVDEL